LTKEDHLAGRSAQVWCGGASVAESGQPKDLENPGGTTATATLERKEIDLVRQAANQTLLLLAKIPNPLLWIS
jgi:hypothetical protein